MSLCRILGLLVHRPGEEEPSGAEAHPGAALFSLSLPASTAGVLSQNVVEGSQEEGNLGWQWLGEDIGAPQGGHGCPSILPWPILLLILSFITPGVISLSPCLSLAYL